MNHIDAIIRARHARASVINTALRAAGRFLASDEGILLTVGTAVLLCAVTVGYIFFGGV